MMIATCKCLTTGKAVYPCTDCWHFGSNKAVCANCGNTGIQIQSDTKSSDPLWVIFLTGDESAALKRADTARKLATYLERMPPELRGLFAAEFQHINRAELAQLRADLQAAQERIAWLTSDIGEDGLAAINRLIAACNRGDIDQRATPDLSIARDEILRQAAQLEQARDIIEHYAHCEMADGCLIRDDAHAWLAANAPTPREQDA